MLLQDKVAIVNGVGPGLGRALCVELAKHGADVVLGARTESRLEEVAAEVRGDRSARPRRPHRRHR